jgi:hypothetical protein
MRPEVEEEYCWEITQAVGRPIRYHRVGVWTRLDSLVYTEWSKKSLCTCECNEKLRVFEQSPQLMIWRWPSYNTFGMCTVFLYRALLNTVFENTVRRVNNVRRLAEETLNLSCTFLYCNYTVHRDFLITLYINTYSLPRRTFRKHCLRRDSWMAMLALNKELG